MGDLNRLAVKAVLILGETLYNERLTRLRTARYEALKAAVEADTLGDSEEVARSIKEYRRLTEEYENVFVTQKELARQEIETVNSE